MNAHDKVWALIRKARATQKAEEKTGPSKKDLEIVRKILQGQQAGSPGDDDS